MKTTTKETERKVKYVVFWERIANSGILEVTAGCHKEAIERVGFNPDYVKMTAYQVEGEALVVGKAN